MIDQIRSTLNDNLSRVESLVNTYEHHPDVQGWQGRKRADLLDILRAGVVLLHASLEDVLRSIARWRLPSANADVLNEIPLVGQRGTNPKKFSLGDLTAFRGKTVDNIFAESVEAHLERSNYNSTNEISKLLNDVGIETAKVNAKFAELQALMDRRHQIVHRADRQDEVQGSGDHKIRGINKYEVRAWAEAVREFSKTVFTELEKLYPAY
jgi:hypothetical protein